MKLLDFLGPEDVQNLVYDVMRKLLLTCYTLFFLSVFKKFAVPILTLTISPAIEKFIENPAAKKKTLSSLGDNNNYYVDFCSGSVHVKRVRQHLSLLGAK